MGVREGWCGIWGRCMGVGLGKRWKRLGRGWGLFLRVLGMVSDGVGWGWFGRYGVWGYIWGIMVFKIGKC